MSILSLASNASAWRGYEYYKDKKVVLWSQINDSEYEAEIKGNRKKPYHVKINVKHPRKSECDCPHAEGTRKICKHKVALFFTVFPEEAEDYIKQIEEYERQQEEREREEEARWQERYEDVEKYVNSLSEEEVRQALISTMLELEERNVYW